MPRRKVNSQQHIAKWFCHGNVLHIWEPVFTVNFYYINACSFDEYKQVMRKSLGIVIDEEKTTDGGFMPMWMERRGCRGCRQGEEIGVIWGDINNIDTIAHEALHAVYWIRSRKKFEYSDEEVWCYLLSFIIRNIVGSYANKKSVH